MDVQKNKISESILALINEVSNTEVSLSEITNMGNVDMSKFDFHKQPLGKPEVGGFVSYGTLFNRTFHLSPDEIKLKIAEHFQ